MKRSAILPELLAPAGSFECLLAAVEAGADAVYVGGKRFGARAFAKNFDLDELSRAVAYCHLHKVKLYVTVNTLIEDREMPEVLEYCTELYRIGVDALIAADLGLIRVLRRHLPHFEIHASTQMSIHSTLGANAAAELGITRAVVARELSLESIKSVCESSKCELEVFLHGALCVCHSGQCLFSSMVGGRSGNRGECAQPCRLPFEGGKYPLSLKDLSLAEHIPELIDSGVASLKIEGRMKSPTYVYTVTKIYRRLLDEHRAATKSECAELRRAFSRDGFTDGYFTGNISRGMTGIRSDGDKESSRALAERAFEPIRKKTRAAVKIKLGEPSEMTLFTDEKTVTVIGEAPLAAINSPLTPESVKARLSKMGNTYLSLNVEDIDLTLDEGVNLAPSALNALRRAAAEALESSAREVTVDKYIPTRTTAANKITTAQFFRESEFLSAASRSSSPISALDFTFIPLFSSPEALSKSNGVYMPPVVLDGELAEVVGALENAKKQGIKYTLVSNIGQITLVLSLGLVPIGDFRLNITNSESRAAYEEMGVGYSVLSPELTLPKARDIGGGVITYGRIPLMITERCFISENFGCEKCAEALLVDRRGESFPMMREFSHRNLIFNSLPTYLGDRTRELSDNRIAARHLLFTTESAEEICRVLSAHRSGLPLDTPVRRAGRR
ncbi:MAG: U32 family peptidase [Ruminococcaceae bacterium]|nr:U32 family peptidase [Oscillospiraceae bacterium]